MPARDDPYADDPYADERHGPDDDARPGRRHATRPARPAWDAMTYGVPTDSRRPVHATEPPPPPAPEPTPPYGSGSSYGAEPPYGPSYGAPPASTGYPGASAYPAASDTYTRSDPYAPPETYRAGEGYPAPGSYAPDAYTTFRAEPAAAPPTGRDDEPVYVAAGLYLDEAPPEPGSGSGPDGQEAYLGRSGRARPTSTVPTDESPSPPKRGGRNVPAAIGVGLVLGAVVLTTLFVWRPAFLAVIALAVGVGIWELVRAVNLSGLHPPLVPLIAGGVLTTGLAWWGGGDGLTFGLVVTVLAVMAWRFAHGPDGYGMDITMATLIAAYVPFLAGFAALLASPHDGARRVLATLIAVVLSDTGGYVVGARLGRHPMAPSVSPKKSWEGLVGSLGAAALGSAAVLALMFGVAPWWGLLFGLAISIASIIGDLGESLLKRDLGVKDMSSLLPGHGGLMDRLDSILFAAPAGFLMLAAIVPVAA